MNTTTPAAASHTSVDQEHLADLDRLLPTVGSSVAHSPLALVFVSHVADQADAPGQSGADTDEADIERLRAEVRGLGVSLLVVAPDAVRCFESDDHFRSLKAPRDVDPRQLAELFRQFGVDPSSSRGTCGPCAAAFVIDPTSEVRFVFRVPPDTNTRVAMPRGCNALLLRALVAASTAFGRKRAPGVPFAELTTRALVAGFEETFGSSRTRRRPSDSGGLTLAAG